MRVPNGRIEVGIIVLLLMLAWTMPSQAGEGEQRPGFVFLRQGEDWSVLADMPPAQRTDPFDPVKYVRLNHDGSSWVSFGGSARARGEHWRNFAFGLPDTDDDVFALWRVMAHADFHFGPRVRLYLEAKTALANGRELPGGNRTIDLDSLAFQQGFVDVGLLHEPSRLTLRLGRQGLQYGKQRLISPLPWGNTLRSWDGATVRFNSGKWTADGFWTRPVVVSRHDSNRSDDGTEFCGAYVTRKAADRIADAYLLFFETENAAFNGSAGEESRYTAGMRLQGRLGGQRGPLGEVEVAIQSGSVGNDDLTAWMLALDASWSLGQEPRSPELGFALDLATGDRSPGAGVQTFNQLYPLGHAYFGIADFVGRQNIQALSGRLILRPAGKWRLVLSPHVFRRFETRDGLYNAGGAIVFPGNAGRSRDVGVEIDVVAAHRFNTHLSADFGYAHFFAGDFVEQAGGVNDIDFGYVQLHFRF